MCISASSRTSLSRRLVGLSLRVLLPLVLLVVVRRLVFGGYCRNEFSVVAPTVYDVVPSERRRRRRRRRRRLPRVRWYRRSLSPLVGPPGLTVVTSLPPVRVDVVPSSSCAACRPPERVFSGSRARTAAPVRYALVALIDPLPRVLSVQNPPPPDKAPPTPLPTGLYTYPPSRPPCSGPLPWPYTAAHRHRHRHRHRHPAPLSLLPSAPLPCGEVRTRRRSKEATSFDAMFTKRSTHDARHRECESARVRECEGDPHTHKWH